MFAIVQARCPAYTSRNARLDGKLFGPCTLVSSHRTLAAAQKAWRKTDNLEHQFRGILTKDGLVNYYGEPLTPSEVFGSVELRMGVFPNE
jgi:hypothetical protein